MSRAITLTVSPTVSHARLDESKRNDSCAEENPTNTEGTDGDNL